MKLADVQIRTKDPELVDWMNNTVSILNQGRYQYRVLTSIPDWDANEGEAVLYASGTDRRLYIYMGGQWCYAAWLTSSGMFETHLIQDANHDTKVDVEETGNEDKIRMDTAGTERVVIDSTGADFKTGNITATLGNINSTVGSMSAGTTVTGGTGVTATTGNVTASAGDVVATVGDVIAGDDVAVSASGKVLFDGIAGDTYWMYNSSSTYLEGWVDGVKRVEL